MQSARMLSWPAVSKLLSHYRLHSPAFLVLSSSAGRKCEVLEIGGSSSWLKSAQPNVQNERRFLVVNLTSRVPPLLPIKSNSNLRVLSVLMLLPKNAPWSTQGPHSEYWHVLSLVLWPWSGIDSIFLTCVHGSPSANKGYLGVILLLLLKFNN